jgi:hypothetical protein
MILLLLRDKATLQRPMNRSHINYNEINKPREAHICPILVFIKPLSYTLTMKQEQDSESECANQIRNMNVLIIFSWIPLRKLNCLYINKITA